MGCTVWLQQKLQGKNSYIGITSFTGRGIFCSRTLKESA